MYEIYWLAENSKQIDADSSQQLDEIVDTNVTTTFHDNSSKVVSSARDIMPYADIVPQLIDSNEIKDFLGRPWIIDSGTLNVSDVSNTILSSGFIEDFLESVSMWQRKLAGYRYIRATARLRLVLNANPFQQGRLLLHFLPCANVMDAAGATYTTSHNINLTQKTQQPCVEVDLQESSCELHIPFVAPVQFHDRLNVSSAYGWGKYFLSVLSPLKVGTGSSTVSWNLFLSFDDVQLSGPIVGPESGPANARIVKERRQQTRTGEISSILDKVSDASGIFSNVPIIGGIASTISEYAGKFADAFSIFGWSKPISDQVGQLVYLDNTRNLLNCDGENKATSFSVNHTANLPIVSNFAGTDLDEMSIAYLKDRKALIQSVNWSISDVKDSSLYSKDVGPYTLVTTGSYGSTPDDYIITYKSTAPAFWLARMFAYWRGGIKYTIKFVKTPFHSGRLLVTFVLDNSSASNATSAYVLREIVDVRSMNEISLVLPYIRKSNYLAYFDSDVDQYTLGRIDIRVLDELKAPDTVANNIDMLLYVSGAEDFELACPTQFKPTFCPESGRIVGDMTMNTKAIGSMNEIASNVTHSHMSTGDPIVSIKQLVQTARKLFFSPVENYRTLIFWPFSVNSIRGSQNYATGNSLDQKPIGDYMSEFASGYVFSRGSVRFTLTEAANTQWVGAVYATDVIGNVFGSNISYVIGDSNAANPQTAVSSGQYGAMRISKNAQWGVDYSCNHYARTPMRMNYMNITNKPPNPDVSKHDLIIATPGSNPPLKTVYKSAGDDYVFGYFIGFAPFLFDAVPT